MNKILAIFVGATSLIIGVTWLGLTFSENGVGVKEAPFSLNGNSLFLPDGFQSEQIVYYGTCEGIYYTQVDVGGLNVLNLPYDESDITWVQVSGYGQTLVVNGCE